MCLQTSWTASHLQQLHWSWFYFTFTCKSVERKWHESITRHWSLSVSPGNIRKPRIFLFILWRKNLVQSFLAFRSVFTKFWSYKVLNSVCMTSSPGIYITFYPWFLLNIFVNFMEKGPSRKFYDVLKFWMIRQCLDLNKVIRANEYR